MSLQFTSSIPSTTQSQLQEIAQFCEVLTPQGIPQEAFSRLREQAYLDGMIISPQSPAWFVPTQFQWEIPFNLFKGWTETLFCPVGTPVQVTKVFIQGGAVGVEVTFQGHSEVFGIEGLWDRSNLR